MNYALQSIIHAPLHEEYGAAITQSSPQILYRDPADVRTILSMAWMGTLLVLLLLASVALNIWQYASALLFARYLKQTGILDKQRSESWQAVWTPQDISVDGADRNLRSGFLVASFDYRELGTPASSEAPASR